MTFVPSKSDAVLFLLYIEFLSKKKTALSGYILYQNETKTVTAKKITLDHLEGQPRGCFYFNENLLLNEVGHRIVQHVPVRRNRRARVQPLPVFHRAGVERVDTRLGRRSVTRTVRWQSRSEDTSCLESHKSRGNQKLFRK